MSGKNQALDRNLLGSLVRRLQQALVEAEGERIGALLGSLREEGISPAALFIEVMRPALAAAYETWTADQAAQRERRAVRALVDGFAKSLTAAPAGRAGAGRRAVLIGDIEGPGLLDRQVLVELLERDGWMVSAVAPDRRDAGRLVAQLEPAAVVLCGDVADGMALRRIRDQLQTLEAPPLLVRCLMEPGDQGGPALRLQIDAEQPEGVAMDRVLERLAQRFDAAGLDAWGVSMRRTSGEVLVVTPSGHLDDHASERLREVVESRRGSFSSVVLNLNELSSSEEPALGELLRWVSDEGWPEPGVKASA